jgi:hypothetical protein
VSLHAKEKEKEKDNYFWQKWCTYDNNRSSRQKGAIPQTFFSLLPGISTTLAPARACNNTSSFLQQQ